MVQRTWKDCQPCRSKNNRVTVFVVEPSNQWPSLERRKARFRSHKVENDRKTSQKWPEKQAKMTEKSREWPKNKSKMIDKLSSSAFLDEKNLTIPWAISLFIQNMFPILDLTDLSLTYVCRVVWAKCNVPTGGLFHTKCCRTDPE
jgi:hypothetical protein